MHGTAALIALLASIGQDPAQTMAEGQIRSIWDFVIKGGPMMIPIGICSLVALTVVIERCVSLRRNKVIPPDFLAGVQTALGNGIRDRTEALEYCKQSGSPIARVLAAGIKRLGEPVELLEKHIQEAGERVVLRLRRYLRLLALIASITPLMGLLGTIFGMIMAFQTVATSAGALGKAELLAKGIYQAMISTAGGLMVAIPVLIAYHWISAKIDQRVSEIDHMTVEFVEQYAHTPEQQASPRLQPVETAMESETTAGPAAVASA